MTKRLTTFLVGAASGLALFGSSAMARPVVAYTPDELAARAQIICVGVPTKITVSEEKGTITLPGNEPDPVRTVIATIRVLGVTKGVVGSEIELRYPALDYEALKARGINGVANGPMQIDLETEKRYRFYLKPAGAGKGYVGALAGDFDDGFAVVGLDAPAPLPPIAPPVGAYVPPHAQAVNGP
jgi:hypothetical protein